MPVARPLGAGWPQAGPGTPPVRVGLHLVLAALPLLTISAHVFGLVEMHVSAGLVVVPLLLVVVLLAVFAPAREERLVGLGVVWGVVATLVYDVVRLDTVYLLGWWDDFIPTMGTWILDTGAEPGAAAVLTGYVWRYVGDGGGIGVTFFVLAAATGLPQLGTRTTVAAAVVFAVVPVWTGLIGTVALAPRGQALMFPLTPLTVALSLVGHLVFGLVLGLGAARCGDLQRHWPWPPVVDLGALRTGRPPALHAVGAPSRPGPPDDPERTVVHAFRARRAPPRPPPRVPAAIAPRWPPPRDQAISADGWGPPESATHGPGLARPGRRPGSTASSIKAPPPVRASR